VVSEKQASRCRKNEGDSCLLRKSIGLQRNLPLAVADGFVNSTEVRKFCAHSPPITARRNISSIKNAPIGKSKNFFGDISDSGDRINEGIQTRRTQRVQFLSDLANVWEARPAFEFWPKGVGLCV
jgi:hypothetical protein